MTASATLSARQAAPGSAIKARMRGIVSDLANYDANSDMGIGVKAGATAPTNISDFAEVFQYNDAGGNGSYADSGRWRDSVHASASYMVNQDRTIPISATVVVGRYLFAYVAGTAGALIAVSPGYHIV